MFKILAIGDPHFKHDNNIETDLMSSQIIDIIKEHNPNFVVILGDILHKHDKIDMFPFIRAINFINDLKNIDTLSKIYILIGNHDRPNNNDFLTTNHPFNSLKDFDKIQIVDDVLIETIDSFNFIFSPYVPVGRFFEALNTKKFDITQISAVFSHQEYKGSKINLLTQSNADEWPLDYPINISGHIHDYEIVESNLIYVGTPFQHSSSDILEKSISLFEFNSLNTNKLDLFIHNRLFLKIPKKITLTMTIEDFKIFVPEDNVKYKIKIKGNLLSINTFLKLEYIKNIIDTFNIKIIPIDSTNSITKIDKLVEEKSTLIEKIANKITNDNNLLKIFNVLIK